MEQQLHDYDAELHLSWGKSRAGESFTMTISITSGQQENRKHNRREDDHNEN